MIFFYNVDNVDKSIDLLENEKKFISLTAEIQQKKKNTILNYMQNFATSDDTIAVDSIDNVHFFLDNLKNSLSLCNDNISALSNYQEQIENTIGSLKNDANSLNTNLSSLNNEFYKQNSVIAENNLKIENLLCTLSQNSFFQFAKSYSHTTDSDVESREDILPEEVEDKNYEFQETDPQIIVPEENIPQVLVSNENTFQEKTFEEYIPEDNIFEKNVLEENSSEENIFEVDSHPENISLESDYQETTKQDSEIENITLEENLDEKKYKENTLIVSEISGKVILPYHLLKVKETYKKNTNRYSSIDDVIQKKYTLPISIFKNPFISRFKEAFKLMRYREKAPISESFELGFELMFYSNLHPAIISACNNLDELDVYLDYLENGETDKFKCFKVIFESVPKVIKNKNSL